MIILPNILLYVYTTPVKLGKKKKKMIQLTKTSVSKIYLKKKKNYFFVNNYVHAYT